MDEADHCSRVGLLRQGRLIADGQPRDLKKAWGAVHLKRRFSYLQGGKNHETPTNLSVFPTSAPSIQA